jgi:hypothetical protein
MREVHERDTGDNADTEPDSRPDAAAGRGSDSRRPTIPIVRDSATWIALALEYRRRVPGSWTGSRRGEPTFPSMHGSCRTRGTSCRTWRGPKSTSGSSASTQ